MRAALGWLWRGSILGILAARNNWQGNGMVPDGISLRRRVDETENNPSEPNIQ
jgi:hypothetical protein